MFRNLPNSSKGILFAVFAIALISVQDLIIKLVSSSSIPIHQMMVIRYVLALTMFGWLVVLVSSYDGLKTKHLGKHLLRGGLAFGSGLSYYLALAVMPQAETVAIFFSAPLFLTVFSVVLLGEKVDRHRVYSVILGFVGVLIMVRPGGDVFNPMTLLVVVAAMCYALSMLLARAMGTTESAVNMSFYAMVCNLAGAIAVAGLLYAGALNGLKSYESFEFLTRSWVMPEGPVWLAVGAVALITVLSFHFITQAYRIAQPSLLALFEYSTMLWAILWGITFFNHYPDRFTMIGIALVVIAGIYTMLWEHRAGHGHKKWFTGRHLHHLR